MRHDERIILFLIFGLCVAIYILVVLVAWEVLA